LITSGGSMAGALTVRTEAVPLGDLKRDAYLFGAPQGVNFRHLIPGATS
jgi:hypothetical protein